MMMMLTCPPLYKIAHRGQNEVMEGKHFETVQEPYSWEAQLFCIENEKKKQDGKESRCLYANLESPKAIIKAIILTFRFKQSFSQFFCICFVFEQNQSKGGREKAPSDLFCKVICCIEQTKTCQVFNAAIRCLPKKVPIQLQRTWFKVKHFVFMRTANVCGVKVIQFN